MQIFTPDQLAEHSGNKYLGVLVAAKFARFVNDFPRGPAESDAKKLTTLSLESFAGGGLTYRILQRRRQEI